MKSAGKKNENESVLKMLDVLNIKVAHITVDAMNTQKKIAEKIIKNNADYTMCVKNNHKKLKDVNSPKLKSVKHGLNVLHVEDRKMKKLNANVKIYWQNTDKSNLPFNIPYYVITGSDGESISNGLYGV